VTLTAGVVTSFGWTGDEADATDDVKRLGLVLSSFIVANADSNGVVINIDVEVDAIVDGERRCAVITLDMTLRLKPDD